MDFQIVNGVSIPKLPWEECPVDCSVIVWRYQQKPVIPRNLLKNSNSISKSAVNPYEGTFAGVFRIDDRSRKIQPEPIGEV